MIKLLVDGVAMHLLEPVSGCTKGSSSKKKGRQSVDSRGGGYPKVVDSSKYSAPILANSILDLDPVCILFFIDVFKHLVKLLV